MITYRKATRADVRPALDLTLRMFIEFQMPDYEPQALDHFISAHIKNENYLNDYENGKNLMFIAVDGEKIIGMINEHGSNHYISELVVDGAYHRKGIATKLMNCMVCELKIQGIEKITLTSSPNGLPFYLKYGFQPTDKEQHPKTGFVLTPMEYIPKEIWDVLDENGNKTGRLLERGREMAIGEYHLAVHVWKHNGRGEWLIDKRTPKKGGKWETTGGAAIAGEDSLTTALREAKEELGLDLDPAKGMLFRRTSNHVSAGHSCLIDVWVFEHNCTTRDICFDENETCDAVWATANEIRELITKGEFFSICPYFDEMAERWRTEK